DFCELFDRRPRAAHVLLRQVRVDVHEERAVGRVRLGSHRRRQLGSRLDVNSSADGFEADGLVLVRELLGADAEGEMVWAAGDGLPAAMKGGGGRRTSVLDVE